VHTFHSYRSSRFRLSPSKSAYIRYNNTLSVSCQGTGHSMKKTSYIERRDTVGHVCDFCWIAREASMSGDYSYNKSQRDALFLKFIFDKELCMFRTDLLSIIRSLNTVYAAIGICYASYVDCLLARSGWNCMECHPDFTSRLST
jgi:hypothetical protein